MNFLGHFYLAGDSASLIVGNFIADFVKGKRYNHYPKEISEGILMHRSIDHYTDQHSMFKKSRTRLRPKYGLYSAVIVDMFYDHILAKNWPDYSADTLPQFSRNIYAVIEEHWEVLPVESRYMFPYMRDHNWLVRYSEIDGIHQSLQGMTRRTRYPSRMDESIVELQEHYPEFESEFKVFFDDIQNTFLK